jgi:hypothetical protein
MTEPTAAIQLTNDQAAGLFAVTEAMGESQAADTRRKFCIEATFTAFGLDAAKDLTTEKDRQAALRFMSDLDKFIQTGEVPGGLRAV